MSKDEEGYNGWTNYETWVVNLWLGNDSYDERTVQNRVNRTDSVYEAAQVVKDYVEEIVDHQLPSAGLLRDLIGHVLDSVNWEEIAVDAYGATDQEDEDEDEDEDDEE